MLHPRGFANYGFHSALRQCRGNAGCVGLDAGASVAVPYAMANVFLTMLGPIIVALKLAG
jgi:hypothetical protein